MGVCHTSGMDKSHYRRFQGYDYTRGASLFITISTEPRLSLDLNAEMAAIAKAGDGAATYWRPGEEPWI